MKGISPLILALSMAYPLGSLAQVDLPPPPPLEAYMAYRAPVPVQERVQTAFWFLRGFYATGYLGYSAVKVTGIENVSTPTMPGNQIPATVKSTTSEGKFTPGIALGYQFRPSGFVDRVEISYMPKTGIDYDANPFLQGLDSSIKGNLSIHPVFFKVYSDFDFGIPIMPYFQLGAGASIVSTSSTAVINIPIFPPVIVATLNGTSSDTQTNFAGEGGVGARVHLSPNFLLDFGYEFDYLGKARWNINFVEEGDPNTPALVNLEARRIYSNTLYAGLTWVPFPLVAPEVDP